MKKYLFILLLFSIACYAEDKKFGNITVYKQDQTFILKTPDNQNIDIDDYAILSNIDITKDNNFKNFSQKYANLSLWPGNHQFPQSQTLPGGIQQLQFTYQLLNGCATCELGGIARIAFNFDADGNFLGTQLLDVEPPPV